MRKRSATVHFMKSSFLLVLLFLPHSPAWILQSLRRIQDDYQALTRRVTARHILLPNTETALTLKQKLRQSNEFLEDAFSTAATKYSQDKETAVRGGLLGELVPQGYCRCEELDQACFQVRLGVVEGPIVSEYGTHLLLVTERTNCPRLDGRQTKLVRSDKVGGELVESEAVGGISVGFVVQQAAFWFVTVLAGGILAELVSGVTNN